LLKVTSIRTLSFSDGGRIPANFILIRWAAKTIEIESGSNTGEFAEVTPVASEV
jgi:hypothetical protein